MTRTMMGGCAMEVATLLAFGVPDAFESGFSMVTSPAPAQGTYLLKATNTTGSSKRLSPSNNFYTWTESYAWLSEREFRLDGTLNAGQQVNFFQWGSPWAGAQIGWLYESASTFKIRLQDKPTYVGAPTVLGTSSNAFSTGASHSIRIEADGTNVRLWVDGTLEFTSASASIPNNSGLLATKFSDANSAVGLAAGQDMYWGQVGEWQSNSAADRPGVLVNGYGLFPNGDAGTNEWGGLISAGAEDCTDTAKGRWQNWDDWVSGGSADDDTEYNCKFGVSSKTEISNLTTATVTNVANVGAMMYARQRIASGTKVTPSYMRLEDGAGNNSEVQNLDDNSATYALFGATFNSFPAGSPVTQTHIDNLNAGIRAPGHATDYANLLTTALWVGLITVDDDPPATATRRRANAGFFGGGGTQF